MKYTIRVVYEDLLPGNAQYFLREGELWYRFDVEGVQQVQYSIHNHSLMRWYWIGREE